MPVEPTSPHSVVKFYKTDFVLGDNALVDDLDDYLETLDELTINRFQYQKHALNLEIKIAKSMDTEYDSYDIGDFEDFNYNYVSITNMKPGEVAYEAETTHYYFIIGSYATSQNTLQLILALDTINTLPNFSSDYLPESFTDNTQITREHQDRFTNAHAGNIRIRKIDKESEGIAISSTQQSSSSEIIDSGDENANRDWYVIYSADPNQAVATYLCADGEIFATVDPTTSSRIYASDLVGGRGYYALRSLNPTLAVKATTYQGYSTASWSNVNATIGTLKHGTDVTRFYRSGNYITERRYTVNNIKFTATSRGITLGISATYSGYEHDHDISDEGPLIRPYWNALFFTGMGSGDSSDAPNTIDILIDNDNCGVAETDWNNEFITVNYLIRTYDCASVFVPWSEASTSYETITYWNIDGTTNVGTIGGIDSVDRTDSRLIKIIKHPYCPINYTYNSLTHVYDFGNKWVKKGNRLKYNDTNLPDFIYDSDKLFVNLRSALYYTPTSLTYQDDKDVNAESKLYHSDFTTPKLVYDSFSKPIKLENFNTDVILSTGFYVDYKPTNTVNSKIAFKLNLDDIADYEIESDYEQYLLSSRNNEETIMNNEYMNYIKNGYNYDKKANQLAVEQQRETGEANIRNNLTSFAVQAGLTIAGTAIGGAAGAVAGRLGGLATQLTADVNAGFGDTPAVISSGISGWETYAGNVSGALNWTNKALGRAQGVAGALGRNQYAIGQLANSAVNSALSAGFSKAELERSIKQTQASQNLALQAKLADLIAQSTAVAGVDDIDLMSYYSDNRLHFNTYVPDDIIKRQLYDIFDYMGYSHNRREVPNVTSRIWHNYLQCIPKLQTSAYRTTKQDWLEDFVSRYAAGVTVFHHNDLSGVTTYDWRNEYENWETKLFN